MTRTRVLVVDDSTVIRKVVSEEIAADPALEVAGTAADGRIALAKMTQVNPDLVVLDVEMPGMDGLQTLAELRSKYPRVPVVMFSALTERGAAATLDALALGATDYVTKPVGGSLEASRQAIRDQLIPIIKGVCRPKSLLPPTVAMPPPVPAFVPARTARIDVVVVGVSTGGPNALAEVFRTLPATLPVPLLIVQHMPATFTRQLADRLTNLGNLPVVEGTTGEAVLPGRAVLAPGGYHLTVVRLASGVVTVLDQEPMENSCRPAADPLFRSAAKVYGSGVLAVVLTGMGYDGQRGCEAVKQAGGQVLAQDEATSVVWGMPGAVAKAGLADAILPLAQVGAEITRRVKGGRL